MKCHILIIHRDVVDTEDFDGGVWKMLIGPLDRVFDNDSLIL